MSSTPPRAGSAVEVVHYDPRWPVRFQEEARRLRANLGGFALRIDHIGSTSVPGLAAKPVIDINLAVETFDPQEVYQPPLEALGFAWRPDDDPAHRLFFCRDLGEHPRRVNLHVCLLDSDW